MAIFPRVVASLAILYCASSYSEPLHVATWGGSHAEVLNSELLVPFAAETGILIERATNNLISLNSEEGPAPLPGVIELDLHGAQGACDRGELLYLPFDDLAGAGGERKMIRDYLPNSIQPCSIAHAVWSTVVAFDAEKHTAPDRPALITDFFNTDDFPGIRVVRRSPRILTEWAIAASGVPLPDIYHALSINPFSWAIIERKLKSIEKDIVWVDSDSQAIDYLDSGQATFAMLGSESVVRYSIENRKDLGVIWNAAVTEFSMWAIPSGAPDPHTSLEFVKYATSVVNSGKVASEFGYGPVRYSSMKLIDQNLQKLLPGWPDNHTNMILGNSSWWREHGGDIKQHFEQWVKALEAKPSMTLTLNVDPASGKKYGLYDGASVLDTGAVQLPAAIPMQ